MAEVGDRAPTERALGLLDMEMVDTQYVKDQPDVVQVLRPRRVVDQYIIKDIQAQTDKEKVATRHS